MTLPKSRTPLRLQRGLNSTAQNYMRCSLTRASPNSLLLKMLTKTYETIPLTPTWGRGRMNPPNLSTHDKALAINLHPAQYGTFAEIGAGQEVARWFFQ